LTPNDFEDIRERYKSPLPTSRQVEKPQNEKKIKKKKKPLTFPWWSKIIGYILSLAFIGVSIFFVIMKGVEFGDQKVSKWLTSLVISFFTSVFLTQPLKVNFFFFVLSLSYEFYCHKGSTCCIFLYHDHA
jgi:hypothetical protein